MTARVKGVRSVAIDVCALDQAAAFYSSVWNLTPVEAVGAAHYFRGTSARHHLLSLHPASCPAIPAGRARTPVPLLTIPNECGLLPTRPFLPFTGSNTTLVLLAAGLALVTFGAATLATRRVPASDSI